MVHPGASRKETTLGRIRSFYGYAVSTNNNLYRKKVARSFAWREFHELWQTMVYQGGTHASSGLLARRAWCGQIDEWLAADPAKLTGMWAILGDLVAEAPSPDATVRRRLRALAALAGAPETFKQQVERLLSSP